MKKFTLLFVIVLALGLALTACGGGGGEATSGGGGADAAAGESLFAEKLVGTQPGCITCHSLEADVVLVGPSMVGMASRAGTTVAGESAEEYLKNSILTPDAHVVDGFAVGTMPAALADELTAQDVDNLVAYLMTLN